MRVRFQIQLEPITNESHNRWYMTITINDSQLQTIAEVKNFLTSSSNLTFKGKRRQEIYELMEDTLIKFEYLTLKKKHKGRIRRYIKKMTGYSRPQLNRLLCCSIKRRFCYRKTFRRAGRRFLKLEKGEKVWYKIAINS